jgi:nucleotide-binding universal stress UspA family protein
MTPKRLNILLADDGSQHAQSAVELLQNIPLPANSRIFVLRAFGPGQVDYLTGFEKALQRTTAQLESKGYRVEADLQLGSAPEQILAITESRKTDLIVMGAKGLRATIGILLGGVAQQVVEYARCPVLVVRAPYQGLRRILLVTDGSTHSQRAARYLGQFPLPKNAEVRVMHVLPPVPQPIMMEPYYGGWQTNYSAFASEEEEKALLDRQTEQGEALLTRTSGLLRRHGIESTPVLVRGDAATEIIDYVKANQVDLIAAGSRGLSQIKSLWMGSVSRKLVHYSACSVLIVKGPRKE